MSTIKTDDRVMTPSYKVKGIVKEVGIISTSSYFVHIQKSADPNYIVGYTYWMRNSELLKCAPFWKGWILVVAPLLFVIASVILRDDLYRDSFVVWSVYGIAAALAFGARCYQFFIQWR